MMPFSDEDLLPPVKNIIDTKVGPMVAQDGGHIELLAVKEGKVFIQLQGACVGCGSSGTTLKFVVEKELQEAIHPELVIVNVPIGMEDKLEEI